jgi:hypothetical protein
VLPERTGQMTALKGPRIAPARPAVRARVGA